jgi:hypothetical protein
MINRFSDVEESGESVMEIRGKSDSEESNKPGHEDPLAEILILPYFVHVI